MNVLALLKGMVTRVTVTRAGDKPQMRWLSARITPDVEVMHAQGLYFIAPRGAQGAGLAPSGDPSVAFAVGLGGDKPAAPEPGEGGLHYLGEWRVFVAEDGTVHLGAKDPSDFVALAGKVDTAIAELKTAVAAGLTAVGIGAAANGTNGANAFNTEAAEIPAGGTVGSATLKAQ